MRIHSNHEHLYRIVLEHDRRSVPPTSDSMEFYRGSHNRVNHQVKNSILGELCEERKFVEKNNGTQKSRKYSEMFKARQHRNNHLAYPTKR